MSAAAVDPDALAVDVWEALAGQLWGEESWVGHLEEVGGWWVTLLLQCLLCVINEY
jgi:hypothetical protein